MTRREPDRAAIMEHARLARAQYIEAQALMRAANRRLLIGSVLLLAGVLCLAGAILVVVWGF